MLGGVGHDGRGPVRLGATNGPVEYASSEELRKPGTKIAQADFRVGGRQITMGGNIRLPGPADSGLCFALFIGAETVFVGSGSARAVTLLV